MQSLDNSDCEEAVVQDEYVKAQIFNSPLKMSTLALQVQPNSQLPVHVPVQNEVVSRQLRIILIKKSVQVFKEQISKLYLLITAMFMQ